MADLGVKIGDYVRLLIIIMKIYLFFPIMSLCMKANIFIIIFKRNRKLSGLVFMSALLILAPLMALLINHANGFADIFIQLTIMYMVCGVFDRIFIDWYWVGHTKAWLIPGREVLMPYIHKKTWIKKIVLTIILYPVLATIIAGIVTLIM